MKNWKYFIERASEWIVCTVYVMIVICSLLVSAFRAQIYGWQILGAVGIAWIVLKVCRKWKITNIKIVSVVLAMGFLAKTLIAVIVKPDMVIDALAIFNLCGEILKNGHLVENAKYIALFPHLLGYISFLLPFFRWINYSVSVAVALNVWLSALSTVIIYFTVLEIFNKKAAIFSTFCWIFWPSQGLWNCFVLSEAFFTTLMLGSVLVLIRALKKLLNKKVNVAQWLGVGILLALFNVTRPFAIIFLIAIFLVTLFIYTSENNKKWFVVIGIAVVGFWLTLHLYGKYEIHIIGREPAGFSWYNVAVGSNEQYGGKWNQEDWDLLSEYDNEPGVSADTAQKKMIPIVKRHISSIKHPLRFIIEKIWNFMGNDELVIIWLKDGGVSFSDIKEKVWGVILNVPFYFIEMVSLSAVCVIHKNRVKLGYLLMICYIGLFGAYMLVEVQERYHYPLCAIQILLVGGFLYEAKKEKGIETKEYKNQSLAKIH